MGEVYAAFDPKLDRRVALKFLRTDSAQTEGHRERLVREARALARLSHPNVVSIFDVADHLGSVYIAMELIDGNNARVWRELGQRNLEEIMKVYLQSLQALVAAHDQGIIHRDFKPDNVLVGADRAARVTDFGLARSAIDVDAIATELAAGSGWERLTQTGIILGTPRYMAPEQFLGKANRKSDQFSFCLSMYEALYGHYPLGTRTPRDLRADRSLEEQTLAPFGKTRVPDSLRRVLLRGMAISPEERWPSMQELDYELRQCLAPREKAQRWLAVGGVAAAIAATAFLVAPSPPPPTNQASLERTRSELDELKRRIAERETTDAELRESRARIRELEEKLSAQRRELILAQMVVEEDEPPPRRRGTAPPPPLPIQSVERSVTTRLSEVLACYEDVVPAGGDQKVSFRVGIDEEGSVKWVTTQALQPHAKANACIERSLAKLSFPSGKTATTASLHLAFFRLESGLLAVNLRASTRTASLGQVTIDSRGRVLVDCQPEDPLCGLGSP